MGNWFQLTCDHIVPVDWRTLPGHKDEVIRPGEIRPASELEQNREQCVRNRYIPDAGLFHVL